MKYAVYLCSILLVVAALGCGGGSSNPVSLTNTPQIAGISPQSGGAGTFVQIWGAYFGAQQGSSIVSYNYEPCVVSSWSDTLITCTIPNTARTSGTFVVTVGGKASAASMQFTLNAPQVTSISPSGGPSDTLVTISGIGFGTKNDNSRVSFNGYNATIESWSNSYITCRVPQGPQNGSVSVVIYINYDYYVSTTFNYVLPSITSIASANSSSTGNNIGAEIAVNGQGFGAYQSEYNGILTFGGTQVSPTAWTSNLIKFRIPAGISAGYKTVALSINGKSYTSGWNVNEPFLSSPSLSTVYQPNDLITLSGNYLGTPSDSVRPSIRIVDGSVTTTVTPTSWSDTSISFYSGLDTHALSDPVVSVSVIVGGLQSNSVNMKVE